MTTRSSLQSECSPVEVGHSWYFQSVDAQRDRRRHYLVTLQRDLWGELVVVRQWGRIGAADWQGILCNPVSNQAEAAKIIRATINRRRQHGYALVPRSPWLPCPSLQK